MKYGRFTSKLRFALASCLAVVAVLAVAACGSSSKSSSSSGGLTADQAAALQYAAQQEAMKETAYYTDAGIPYSSGLAYDLGSIGQQTAANAAQIEQGNVANQLAANAQQFNQQNALGNQLAYRLRGLDVAAGGLLRTLLGHSRSRGQGYAVRVVDKLSVDVIQ